MGTGWIRGTRNGCCDHDPQRDEAFWPEADLIPFRRLHLGRRLTCWPTSPLMRATGTRRRAADGGCLPLALRVAGTYCGRSSCPGGHSMSTPRRWTLRAPCAVIGASSARTSPVVARTWSCPSTPGRLRPTQVPPAHVAAVLLRAGDPHT